MPDAGLLPAASRLPMEVRKNSKDFSSNVGELARLTTTWAPSSA